MSDYDDRPVKYVDEQGREYRSDLEVYQQAKADGLLDNTGAASGRDGGDGFLNKVGKFFHSVAGIITGIVALLTALAGLFKFLHH